MNLKKVLTKDLIIPHLKAETKPAVIEEIIDLLVQSGKIKDRETALKAVLTREQKMSTGMQNGIAIPHGKTDSVDHLEAVIAIKPEGIDFDALDGQPSSIFILTLSPANRTGPHIQFLAEISKLLGDPQLREQLTKARTVDEIFNILTV